MRIKVVVHLFPQLRLFQFFWTVFRCRKSWNQDTNISTALEPVIGSCNVIKEVIAAIALLALRQVTEFFMSSTFLQIDASTTFFFMMFFSVFCVFLVQFFCTFSKKLVDANSEHINLCASKSVKPTYILCFMLSMALCCLPARFVVILFVVYILFLVAGNAFQN